MSINKDNIKPIILKGICPRYIAKVIPLAFDESMSYYECLCALLEYINKQIVPDINNMNENVIILNDKIEEAYDYLKDNLNETVNNIIHEELEKGTITFDLINLYDDETEELQILGSAEGSNE